MQKRKRHLVLICAAVLFLLGQPVWAAGPPAPSPFDNPMIVLMVILMIVLLFVIGILANVLLGVADVKRKKEKENRANSKIVATVLLFLLSATYSFAQDVNAEVKTVATDDSIAGMATSVFYTMGTVIFIELLVILVLLINVRLLLRAEKQKKEIGVAPVKIVRKKISNIWEKLNSFKPVEQEADIDLGHDYDGIRELDNRLPPWWLYGFYLTIIVSCIYLWRFHISHTGPTSQQEYETAVADADIEIKEYLKKKGESVDENTVVYLPGADDLAAGKNFFIQSCKACHKESGAGEVGPNLTDKYWMHGGDIKSIFKTIRYGINAMPQWQNSYSNKQIAQIASYVKSLQGTNPANAKEPQGTLYEEKEEPVKPAMDSAAAKENKLTMN